MRHSNLMLNPYQPPQFLAPPRAVRQWRLPTVVEWAVIAAVIGIGLSLMLPPVVTDCQRVLRPATTME